MDEALQLRRAWPFDGIEDVVGGSEQTYRVSGLRGFGICSIQARRGCGAELAALAREIGVSLPSGPKMTKTGEIVVLGTGPDMWLVLESNAQFQLYPRLRRSLDQAATLVELSDAYALVTITGPLARAVLAKGVSLDLYDEAFGPGDVAATRLAHLGVILWRMDDVGPGESAFVLAIARSYAASFVHWLAESTAEFRARS